MLFLWIKWAWKSQGIHLQGLLAPHSFPDNTSLTKECGNCQNAFLLTATQITLRWEISSILAKLFISIERLVDRSRFSGLWFLSRDCISQLWVLSPCRYFLSILSNIPCQCLWCKAGKQSPQASSAETVKGELRQPWIFPAEHTRLLPWDFVSSEVITSSLAWAPFYLEISKCSICVYCLIKPDNSF